MTLFPARLEPRFVPRIWGATSLAPLFPEKAGLAEPIGEVWLTGDNCVFAEGPFAGSKLAEAWGTMPADWAGTRLDTRTAFPLLIKFLFPEQKLSIQVHPSDDYAQRYEAAAGGRGKTEMWHAVAARPGAEVLVGLKPGTTPAAFRRAIAEGTAEDFLVRIAVAAGDSIFVPAGTMHTISPGAVLCEIQENSDLTYRVFDYNRKTAEGKPRELHIEKALAVANFGEPAGGKLAPVRLERFGVVEQSLVACRYFATERWEFRDRVGAVTSHEHFDLLVFLEGRGRMEAAGASHQGAEYAPAQVWFVPAALGAYNLAPQNHTVVLRTYVPDLQEFARRLADRGVAESLWSQILFP
jgi:mannose-6-phosphate isomerase